MAATNGNARRQHGTVYSRLTSIEWDIIKLQEKEGLTPLNQKMIKRLNEQAKEDTCNRDFEQQQVQ